MFPNTQPPTQGNPLFTPLEFMTQAGEPPAGKTLKDILDG